MVPNLNMAILQKQLSRKVGNKEYIKYVVGKVSPTVENLKKLLHCYCHNHYLHSPYYPPNHINNNPITQGEFIYKILIAIY